MKDRNAYRKMPAYSMKGVSDIIAVHNSVPYFIEAKSQIGKQSKDQKEFQKKIEKSGGVYILAHSIDDISSFF